MQGPGLCIGIWRIKAKEFINGMWSLPQEKCKHALSMRMLNQVHTETSGALNPSPEPVRIEEVPIFRILILIDIRLVK